ncbi:MAG TPA: MOSC domain-containing protein [Terriglobia bacterium]|nr:MOSC domain-containing protein [Terriglobia bacterium]
MSPARLGRLTSINRSDGGVPKKPVAEVLITESGLTGDRQRDLRYHGGPDRAVLLYSMELIRALQKEGHSIDAGATGENLTVSGLDWKLVVPGTEIRVAAVRLLVTKYAPPCHNISGCFLNGDITRVAQKVHPGWSRVCAKVLAPGTVRVGDSVRLGER